MNKNTQKALNKRQQKILNEKVNNVMTNFTHALLLKNTELIQRSLVDACDNELEVLNEVRKIRPDIADRMYHMSHLFSEIASMADEFRSVIKGHENCKGNEISEKYKEEDKMLNINN